MLNEFYTNIKMRDEVKSFLMEHLKRKTLDNAFAGRDTAGAKEARDAINTAFYELDKTYGAKRVSKPQSTK